jgi:hypothetical protein
MNNAILHINDKNRIEERRSSAEQSQRKDKKNKEREEKQNKGFRIKKSRERKSIA